MKNEIRGFIFLALSVICFCTHQMCDKLWWIMAYIGGSWSNTGSILYGGCHPVCAGSYFSASCRFLFPARHQGTLIQWHSRRVPWHSRRVPWHLITVALTQGLVSYITSSLHSSIVSSMDCLLYARTSIRY